MMEKVQRPVILYLIAVIVLSSLCPFPGMARGVKDSPDDIALLKEGSAEEIQQKITADKKFSKKEFGDTKDTALMYAIAANRSDDIISLLVAAKISPVKANKNGQDAVIYAFQYPVSPQTARTVITAGTLSDKAVRKRLLKKDKSGQCAASYAFQNGPAEKIALISDYLTADDIISFLKTASAVEDTPVQPADETPAPQPAEEQNAVPHQTGDTPPAVQTEDQSALTLTVPSGAPPAVSAVPPAAPNADTVLIPQTPDARRQQAAGTEAPAPETNTARAAPYKKIFLFDGIPDEPAPAPETEQTGQHTAAAEPDKPDRRGITPLMKYAQVGNTKKMTALLNSGAALNDADEEGWTALMYAAREKSGKAAQLLIDRGADIKKKNLYDRCALDIAAAYSENSSVVKSLLAAYTINDIEVFRSFIYALTNSSAVPAAAQREKIMAFLEKGIPVNRFWQGKTPLMYAAESATTTVPISILLSNGALASLREADGKTAFDYAQANKNLPHDDVYWSLNTGKRK